MITVVDKNGVEHRNLDGEAVRDDKMLTIIDKDKIVIAEFNDSWAYWYEQS